MGSFLIERTKRIIPVKVGEAASGGGSGRRMDKQREGWGRKRESHPKSGWLFLLQEMYVVEEFHCVVLLLFFGGKENTIR